MLKLYRIISYMLLPIGVLLGIGSAMGIILSLSNFAMLISVFLCGSTVIYIFTSFIFLQKAIDQRQTCKPSLKDWIKVNAYVACVFSALCIVNSIAMLANPQQATQMVDAMLAVQPAELKKGLTTEAVYKIMKGMMYIMLVLGVAMLFHISSTFRLLKQWNGAFGGKP